MFTSKLFVVFLSMAALFVLCDSAAVLPLVIPVKCDQNQTFHHRSHCEETCESLSGFINDLELCSPGCRCANGYVRNGPVAAILIKQGNCIKKEDCSTNQ